MRMTERSISEHRARVWSRHGVDHVVAFTADDAAVLFNQFCGDMLAEADEFRALDDDEKIAIWCDASGEPCAIGEGSIATLTAREWATREPGFLSSMEE